MGMKIKFWTSQPLVATTVETEVKLTKAGKPRNTKAPAKPKTVKAKWEEVAVEISTLGITPEFWDDEKNVDAVDAILKAIPGINLDFGIGVVRY